MKVKFIPFLVTAILGCYLFSSLRIPQGNTAFNTALFSQVPVLHGGRVKPIDTVARTSLLMLSGKQTAKMEDGSRMSAIAWLMDLMFTPDKADNYKVFEINDPDVLGLIGIQQKDERLFSYATLIGNLAEIDKQAGQAARVPQDKRSRFQGAIYNLRERIFLYDKLKTSFRITAVGSQAQILQDFDEKARLVMTARAQNTSLPENLRVEMQQLISHLEDMSQMTEFLPIPISRGNQESESDWTSVSEAMLARFANDGIHPALLFYGKLHDAYQKGDAGGFNALLGDYMAQLSTTKANAMSQSSSESLFNNFEPFYKSMMLYVLVLLLACTFWLTQKPVYNQTAFWLLVLACSVHTLGLAARVILQGRPPVTNLYSSAVFVGWGSVVLGLVLEKLYKNGVGNVVSAVIGFTTLIIAHHLSLQGDTMEMMRAVLDSNFWLATHVITITIGYSSTFLSGLIAIVYLFRRAFDRGFDPKTAHTMGKMVYGIVCFSTVFSFVGTVLGGIWADQSWGRFWGWDPKENGALLVVLWNILILHCRTAVTPRTIMVLTVFGNVVTAMSWFGVNMLGVGLHSYGFMDKALAWLMIFTLSQCFIMMLGYFKPAGAAEQ